MARMPGGRPHVVIVGAGFGGLYAARELAAHPVRVTVVDRENYHLFQPLLYQVATAALSPGDIAEPIRSILRTRRGVRVLLGEATAVDLARRRVALKHPEHEDAELAYDYLIVATGARHSYFGHPEWEGVAPGLKSLEDALEIRRRILSAFEAAEWENDSAVREALLTFVVVGGGPTGVELAGAIAEIARQTVAHDFRAIDPTRARVILVEGNERLLMMYPEDLSASAACQLAKLGVEVRTEARVTDVTPEAVHIGDEVVATRTVMWAAGVTASPLGKALGVPVGPGGHVSVEGDLTIAGHPEVYVIGDLASLVQDGKPLPGVAPVAIQQGLAAADNIMRTIAGRPRRPFRYDDRGSLATIGRQAGVADLGRVHLSGLVAWLAWLFVHVYYLIGFDNRMLVVFKWAWSYVTFRRDVRLITHPWPHGRVAEEAKTEAEAGR